MTKHNSNIIDFSKIQGIKEIPSINGFRILENFVIEKFYQQKHSHSTDLYTFRLVSKNGRMEPEPLFFGMLEGEDSNLSPDIANTIAGKELHNELTKFAKSAPSRARGTNKCLIEHPTEYISLIACTSDRGTIIGGWYNSNADQDVGMQMLAYCMASFAMLNNVDGKKDTSLKKKAIDTIPDDSRFGKYSANFAEAVFLSAIAGRHDRMLKRAQAPCPIS